MNPPENREPENIDRLDDLFHKAMLSLYDKWRTECRFRDRLGKERPYVAARFRQGVINRGGFQAARNLLRKRDLSPGFLKLKENELLGLSVEALVLQPEWRKLFSDEEIAVARQRLLEADYKL